MAALLGFIKQIVIFAKKKEGRKAMTAIEINAEIYRSLGYLSENENYLRKAMKELKKLALQMRYEKEQPSSQKIKVRSMPLSIDQYVGIASPNREDDKLALEEYLAEKYNKLP